MLAWPGLELWRRLELDCFFEQAIDEQQADVPWSRVAAALAINRLCAPGSELAVEERWYPSTALDDLLSIEDGKPKDTRLYRCLDRILPHKMKLEKHLQQRQGAADLGIRRGTVSEENLRAIRKRGGRYLVGTPRSQMKQFEAELLKDDWTQAIRIQSQM